MYQNKRLLKAQILNFKMLLICLIGFFVIAKASEHNPQKPVLQEILLPRKLVEKQDTKLYCVLLQGSRPIKFSWFFNGEPIRQTDDLQVIVREDESNLLIRGLSVDNIGRYKCLAANDQGSDQQTVALYVNSKRTLAPSGTRTEEPRNRSVWTTSVSMWETNR